MGLGDTFASCVFETFVVAPSNGDAFWAARDFAEATATPPPLLVTGARGTGKSHLLRAIGAEATRLGAQRVEYVTGRELSLETASALRFKTLDIVLAACEKADVLIVDDVDWLAGQGTAQSAVAGIIGRAYARGFRVALSATRPLDDELALPLEWVVRNSTRAMLGEPGVSTREGIVRHHIASLGGRLEDATIAGIVERNPHADGHVLQRLVRSALPLEQMAG
jgi:chromosomal replication initiator protein